MALSVVGTLRGRLLAREAVSSKGKRAGARNTMKAPNNQSPQHFATIRPHNAIVIMQTTQALWHKQRKRDNANNASVIMANSRQHLALRSCAHLAAHGEAHLGSNSRAHIVATIRGHLGDANTGQTSGQLATFKGAASRLHLRPTRVGNNNPGARFFILKAANPPMIRGLYRKQLFIPRTISIAYSIRDADHSGPNDKLRL
jgi:hypothetical protein